MTPALPPSGTSVQYAAAYTYDVVNRLTGVSWNPAPTAATPTASSITFGHSYNKANQRVGQSISDNSWVNYPAATASTVSYTANALNQYTAVGAVSPTYDGNANLTSDGTYTLGYDAENRLISASGAGNTASYAFDAQGRRKTRTVNGTTTVFVTDADNREVLEYDGASGAIQRWYAYALGPNDVLSQMNVPGVTRATLVPDIQGSVIASLDSGTGALSKLGYLPYGRSPSAGPFGYTGQRVDVETGGLYYYRARHYSPAWGRFLQPDSIGYKGGINLYAYVGNAPLNLIDPFGTCGNSPGCGGGGEGGLVAGIFGDPRNWPQNFAAAGAIAGAIVGGGAGGLGGAAGGTLVAPGVGTVGGAVGGVIYGAAQGAALGGSAGYAIGATGLILMNQNQSNQGGGSVGGDVGSRIEKAVQGELGSQGDLYAETYSLEKLSGPTSIANPDPSLGANQVRYYATVRNGVTGQATNFSVNYDPETGAFGIIKQSSIQP